MKNKQHNELAVCGFAAVKALADIHPEKITRLYFTPDRAPAFGTLCSSIAERRGLYRQVESPEELEKLAHSVHHQGVVAMIPEPYIPHLNETEVSRWITEKRRVLVLDRIGNANNFGAIVRSAAFFGIRTIIITEEDNQAQITTSTYRIAQGGMEYVDIFSVTSTSILLRNTERRLTRIGTDVKAAKHISDLHEITQHKSCLVILGNEETGLCAEVKGQCDILITISGSGQLDSLNVAQAATLFLHEMSR